MNWNRRTGFIVIFLAATFLLLSCDQNKPFKDLQDYIDKLKAAKVNVAADDKKVKEKDAEPVVTKYDADSKRSPFEVLEAAPVKNAESSNPLQAYPLDMLRFVGTVTQNGNTIAFITAPDNKIYQVKVGDVIGDHESHVITIESDRISLMEQYSENGNNPMKRVVTLQLKDASQ